MTRHNYHLARIPKANQLRGILADGAPGRITYVDGTPTPAGQEAIDILLEIIGETASICEDFVTADWDKSDISIDQALAEVESAGHYLYAAVIEKSVLNPFTSKMDSLSVMVLVISEQKRDEVQLDPQMIDDLPVSGSF
jgi:hypothetical protein